MSYPATSRKAKKRAGTYNGRAATELSRSNAMHLVFSAKMEARRRAYRSLRENDYKNRMGRRPTKKKS